MGAEAHGYRSVWTVHHSNCRFPGINVETTEKVTLSSPLEVLSYHFDRHTVQRVQLKALVHISSSSLKLPPDLLPSSLTPFVLPSSLPFIPFSAVLQGLDMNETHRPQNRHHCGLIMHICRCMQRVCVWGQGHHHFLGGCVCFYVCVLCISSA